MICAVLIYSALISSLAIAIPAIAVKPKIMYVTNMIHFLKVVGSTTQWLHFTHLQGMNQMHCIYIYYDYLV